MRHLWLIGGWGFASGITVTTPPHPSAGTVGAFYSITLTATGGTAPYSWSVSSGTLPGGLTLAPGGTIAGTPTLEGIFALTFVASLISVLASAVPPPGACTVTGNVPGHLAANTRALDAGASLSLSGPVDPKTITTTKKGVYTVLLGPQVQGPALPAGDYTISGTGGKDVGSFSVTLNAREPIVWTNPPAAGATLDAAQPLTFTWSGGNVPGHVIVGGAQESGTTFLCSADMAQRTFTVPTVFLSSLVSGRAVALIVAQHPLERQVSVPGMDIAYFVDVGSGSVSVQVK